MKLKDEVKAKLEPGFLSEIMLSNTDATVLRLSKKNRQYINRICRDMGISMNFLVNRILFCERQLNKYEGRYLASKRFRK
jgi:hypothetical protein